MKVIEYNHSAILTGFFTGITKEDCETIVKLTDDGYNVYLIEDPDDRGKIVGHIVYGTKHEKDGQLMSGSFDSYIEFKNNNFEIYE